MKRLVALCSIIMVLVLTGCGSDNGEATDTIKKVETKQYKETNVYSIPNENMAEQDTLVSKTLERNLEGKLAMYCLEKGYDEDGLPYASVLEYTLDPEQDWQKEKVICKESLTALVQENMGQTFHMPFIIRGDDGCLYALLERASVRPDIKVDGWGTDDDDMMYEYSMLQLDEEDDVFYETKFELSTLLGENETYFTDKVNKFHVLEDGTPNVVFASGKVVHFDVDTGEPTDVFTGIDDRAFSGNVGYNNSGIFYYSTEKKMFGMLDSQNMEVLQHFGDEISEENRTFQWYFDTQVETWNMYALNQSGLYRLEDSGKKITATCLSMQRSFEALGDRIVYDVLVDENEVVYVLAGEEVGEPYEAQYWSFYVTQYSY